MTAWIDYSIVLNKEYVVLYITLQSEEEAWLTLNVVL